MTTVQIKIEVKDIDKIINESKDISLTLSETETKDHVLISADVIIGDICLDKTSAEELYRSLGFLISRLQAHD